MWNSWGMSRKTTYVHNTDIVEWGQRQIVLIIAQFKRVYLQALTQINSKTFTKHVICVTKFVDLYVQKYPQFILDKTINEIKIQQKVFVFLLTDKKGSHPIYVVCA